ncbi:MAG: SDR family oxidoreductase [Proteobacteria bacterium]|nr:SDR family oxidoreductase [Pseudomonadota bacterium]
MYSFDKNYWALIIGGSSGFGLATAHKLANHGMNICIVHRDRRASMRHIEPSFEVLRKTGVAVLTFNLDALSSEGRNQVLDTLSAKLSDNGKVRLVLHSLAFGNLKLMAPFVRPDASEIIIKKMAETLNIDENALADTIQNLFDEGHDPLYTLSRKPEYANDMLLDESDFSRTLHAMGYNIIEWVRDIHQKSLFSENSRVLSLTSEGNHIAWRSYAAVSAAKAVLESVSRSMAVEYAPYGVRTNVIQAGVTDTAALRAIPGSTHIRANARLRNPCGRLTTPEDVANVIYLLCMDESAWVNGSLICVDGGERIG